MRNDEVIKLAVSIVNENNSIRKSAKNQAFMIKATDGSGTQDSFVTIMNTDSPSDWKRKFQSVGFKNISVSPWPMSGNLSMADVDANFFNEITNRPKIGYQLTPERKNPFKGRNLNLFSGDPRLGSTHTFSRDNFLQKYLADKMMSPEKKIRAGWFDGDIISWLNKTVAMDKSLEELMKQEFPNIYSSRDLLKHIVEQKIDASTYMPTEQEIDHFGIDMYPLITWINEAFLRSKIVPSKLMLESLDKVLESARRHPYNKQYADEEMQEFQDARNQKLVEREDNTRRILELLLRSKAR